MAQILMMMESLEDLAKKLSENPGREGQLLDEFLTGYKDESKVGLSEVQNLLLGLQRIRKLFVGTRNQLEGNHDLLVHLYHCTNVLDQATMAFSTLEKKLNAI